MSNEIAVPRTAASVIRKGQQAAQDAARAWQNYAHGVGAGMGVPEGYVLEWQDDQLFWVPPPGSAVDSIATATLYDAGIETTQGE